MTKTVEYITINDDGKEEQRRLNISDSASFIIRFESNFNMKLSDLNDATKLPSDIGIRIAYSMAKPRPEVDYEHWVEDMGFTMKNMTKVSELTMEFLGESLKNA